MAPALPGETRFGITALKVLRPIICFDDRCPLCLCEIAHHGGLDRAEGVIRLDLYAQPESPEGN